MFKRNRIVILLAALALLIGIYFIIDLTGSEDRTFKSQVLSFDPELVTSLEVKDMQTGDKIEIKFENEEWVLYSGGKKYSGAPEAITNAIATLAHLQTESIAATRSDKWEEYMLEEDQAIHITLNEGNKQSADIYVGRFDFKQIPATQPGRQPQTKMSSYVRTADDDRVYVVNGLLRSNFQGGINTFRNRTLFFCENQNTDIRKLTLSSPEGMLNLDLSGREWLVNGIPADSVKTAIYLKGLARLRSSTYVDDVEVSGMTPAYTLEIEGTSFDKVTLAAYPADTIVKYYVTSSTNWGSVFNGAKGNLFEKTFVGIENFLP